MELQIQNYSDFLAALDRCGFTMGGGNSEGIYSLISWDWKQEPPYHTPVAWHTGDRDTDPWEWRIRVLEEKQRIAYSKLFFKKSGYITKAWYPRFLAARRGAGPYEAQGDARDKIYELICDNGALPLHVIKLLGGFGKGDKAEFEKALLWLQGRMYITMCGSAQKHSKLGEAYGWSSTVFCTAEAFWGPEVFEEAARLEPSGAKEEIRAQILRLNPQAPEKKIQKFIAG